MPGKPFTMPALDQDGYLRKLSDWSPEVAQHLAAQEAVVMNEKHWEIINLLRIFHEKFGLSPGMRPLVRFIASELGKEKGNSLYLMQLFPGNPALKASRIAGLPRPENCF